MNKNEILNDIENLKEIYIKIRKEIIKKLDTEREISTGDKQDKNINSYLQKSNEIFNNLEYKLEKVSEDKSISVIEIEKNSEIIKDIKHNFEKLKESYESNIKNLKPNQNLYRKFSRCNPEDIVNVNLIHDTIHSQYDVSDIVQLQIRKQDEVFEQFSGMAKKIRQSNEEIHDELNKQQKMITGLHKKVDKTKVQVIETQNKMDYYLQKSSTWGLFGFIALEILIIVLLLIN